MKIVRKQTFPRISFFVFLILAGLVLRALCSETDEYTRRDTNVGRVIMALIGSEIVDRDPGEALLRDITTRCEGDDIYCYEAQPSYAFEGRNIQYDWTAKIEFNQPYASFRDVPIPESWLESTVGVDQGTDGHIFYRESGAGTTPRGRVVIKKLANGVLLTLTETRPLREPQAKLIERAMERWRIFDQAAKKYALYGDFPYEVICHGGDMDGMTLEDGDVVFLVAHENQKTILSLEIVAQPGLVPQGRTAKIYFTLSGAQEGITTSFIVTQNGRELDSDIILDDEGDAEIFYELPTTSGSEQFEIEITPEGLEASIWKIPPLDSPEHSTGELFWGAVIDHVEISLEGHRLYFFVQASPWEMAITRFWVIQDASRLREEEVQETGITYPELPDMRGREYTFNDYITHLGRLLTSYSEGLKPQVIPKYGQGYKPDEKAYIGWAKDEDTGHTFYTYTDDPEDRTKRIPAYLAINRMFVEFDLEILLHPKARTFLDEDTNTWKIDKYVYFTDWDRQKEIWGKPRLDMEKIKQTDFIVSDISITLHEIEPESGGIRGPAKDANFLRGALASPREKSHINFYVNNKDRDIMSHNLIYKATAQPYPFGPLHIGGFFEVRLSIDVAREIDGTDVRGAEAAIRFRTSRGKIETGRIHWDTQKLSIPPRKK